MRVWVGWSLGVGLLCGGCPAGDDGSDSGAMTSGPTSTTATSGDSGSGGADGSGSSGDVPTPACIDDSECMIVDSCSNCRAEYVGGEGAPAPSDGSAAMAAGASSDLLGDRPMALDIPGETCEVMQCEAWGNPTAECRFGRCVISKLHCGTPACDLPPPECTPPWVPLIDARGSCWTGSCAPVWRCDLVQDCLDCNTAQVCVTFEGASAPTCEQPPPDCEPELECECAGAALCGEAACSVVDDGIVCG